MRKQLPRWKRTHIFKPEQFGVDEILDWTNKKTGTKVLITQYHHADMGRNRYCYNLPDITPEGKEECGKCIVLEKFSY